MRTDGWSSGATLEYYGELDETGSFTIPDGYDTDCNMYLVAEQVNDGNLTDYASAPAKIEHARMKNIQVVILNSDPDVSGGETEAGYSAVVDTDTASEGDIVYFAVRPKEGTSSADKAVVKVMSGGKVIDEFTLEKRDGIFKGAFIMPPYPVTITAELLTEAGPDEKVKAITPAVTLSASAYVFNGKVRKPAVTVKDGSTVIDASQYDVIYASGRRNVGTYKVTVRMKGSYSGSRTVSFRIDPKGTSISRVN